MSGLAPSNVSETLITHYEVNGLSVEEIALALEMDEGVVRLALQGGSALYKARVESNRELDVSREEAAEMMGIVKNLARGRDDACAAVRLKAAIYANEEYHGRNDSKSKAGGSTFHTSILTLNQHLQRVRAARGIATGKPAAQESIAIPA